MDRYLQGESPKLKMTLKDALLNVPIDISALESLHVKVFHVATGAILEQGTYGVDNLVSTTPADGVVFFPIEGSLTESATVGVYKVLVTIETNDTHFEDDTLIQKKEVRAFKIVSTGNVSRTDYTELTLNFPIGTDYFVDEDIYVDEDINI